MGQFRGESREKEQIMAMRGREEEEVEGAASMTNMKRGARNQPGCRETYHC